MATTASHGRSVLRPALSADGEAAPRVGRGARPQPLALPPLSERGGGAARSRRRPRSSPPRKFFPLVFPTAFAGTQPPQPPRGATDAEEGRNCVSGGSVWSSVRGGNATYGSMARATPTPADATEKTKVSSSRPLRHASVTTSAVPPCRLRGGIW